MRKVFAAFIMLILAVFMESCRENRIFKVKKYKLPALDSKQTEQGRKILFLSDLHNHIYGNDNDILFDAVQKENPDLILIGGDMLIGKHSVELDAASRFCKKLPEIAPVYYALGNHEQRMKRYPERYGTVIYDYMNELENSGIHFLKNDSVDIKLGSLFLRITGLDLPIDSYERSHQKQISKDYIERLVGAADKEVYQILLAHNPSHFKSYKEWGADLVLSGHLHGGVARIPGWRGVITPHFVLFPKYSGEMSIEEGHTIIVSKGLGTHTIKFRILNYPEIVVAEF